MIAKQAFDAATAAKPGERLHCYETMCAQRGLCECEPLATALGHWTWCPDCLTLYNDYGKAVNRLPPLHRGTSRISSPVVETRTSRSAGPVTETKAPEP